MSRKKFLYKKTREVASEALGDILGRNKRESRIYSLCMFAVSACAFFEPGDPNHVTSAGLTLTGFALLVRSTMGYEPINDETKDVSTHQQLQEVE